MLATSLLLNQQHYFYDLKFIYELRTQKILQIIPIPNSN